MLVQGMCQKQNLMQSIYNAILSPGSNWTEISSNKTNDYKWTGTMTDGWVFKSPPIGPKAQNVFFNLKSIDLSIATATSVTGQGGNHFLIWLADYYVPNATSGVNGTFTNKGAYQAWCFTKIDNTNHAPSSLYDYFIDIEDYRIIIIIQDHTATTTTYPQILYVGYPEPSTNIEGDNYTNQFVIGSNIYNSNSVSSPGLCYWHKASNGLYNRLAATNCNTNTSNPNPMGLYLLTPITVTGDGGTGVTNTGPLGVLNGIYGLPTSNIVNGDTITIGYDTYQTFSISQYTINNQASVGGTATLINYMNGINLIVIAIKVS